MALTIRLHLLGEVDGRTHYVEETAGDEPPTLGTISIESSALPQPPPPALEVAISFREAGTAAPPDLTRFIPPPPETLQVGDRVTVVKDRDSGIRYPPEWLKQYLGRTGRILWTTAGGAMVKLEKEATWFPYNELERTEPEA